MLAGASEPSFPGGGGGWCCWCCWCCCCCCWCGCELEWGSEADWLAMYEGWICVDVGPSNILLQLCPGVAEESGREGSRATGELDH